jgi:hypothetical protein
VKARRKTVRAADFLWELVQADPYARLRAAVVEVATEDEVSAALGTRWPWYRGATGPDSLHEEPSGDLALRVLKAYHAARQVGAGLSLRGSPIRGGRYRGIQKTAAFGARVLALYDLFASRIPMRRRTLLWAQGPVPGRFNVRAAALVASVLNTTGWSSRMLSASDVLGRVQRRPPLSNSPRK